MMLRAIIYTILAMVCAVIVGLVLPGPGGVWKDYVAVALAGLIVGRAVPRVPWLSAGIVGLVYLGALYSSTRHVMGSYHRSYGIDVPSGIYWTLLLHGAAWTLVGCVMAWRVSRIRSGRAQAAS